jgi:hypothetical protein
MKETRDIIKIIDEFIEDSSNIDEVEHLAYIKDKVVALDEKLNKCSDLVTEIQDKLKAF